MKQIFYKFFPLIVLLLSIACKDDNIIPPIEDTITPTAKQLVFSCLLNGKLYQPKSNTASHPQVRTYYAYYEKLYSQGKYNYQFGLVAYDLTEDPKTSIGIYVNDLKLEIGKSYDLVSSNTIGNAYADYMVGEIEKYTIATPLVGKLTITHLDEEKQTIAGTFWFDAVNAEGRKVEVSEGRFQMSYLKGNWFNR